MGDAPPSDNRLCEILNKSFARGRNPSVALLGGKIVSFDREAQSMRMEFAATPALDNGNAQVMGGFLGAMMDVTVAQAAVVQSRLTQTVATLEQKVTLLAPVRLQKGSEDPVPLFCEATAIKLGRSVAFYEVSIENAKGVLVARASQTTSLITLPTRKPKAAKL